MNPFIKCTMITPDTPVFTHSDGRMIVDPSYKDLKEWAKWESEAEVALIYGYSLGQRAPLPDTEGFVIDTFSGV